MRPAQKAPENRPERQGCRGTSPRFNEAGAKSAGKRVALCLRRADEQIASMRPAQKAPENRADIPRPPNT